jgi:hypothetical protein
MLSVHWKNMINIGEKKKQLLTETVETLILRTALFMTTRFPDLRSS